MDTINSCAIHTYSWCLNLVPIPGTYFWYLYLVPIPGTYLWYLFLETLRKTSVIPENSETLDSVESIKFLNSGIPGMLTF